MVERLTTRIPLSLCPVCGHTLDSSESLSSPAEAPAAGDWTVCIGCAAILEFDQELRLSLVPHAAAAVALAEDADLRGTVGAIKTMHRMLGRPRPKQRPN